MSILVNPWLSRPHPTAPLLSPEPEMAQSVNMLAATSSRVSRIWQWFVQGSWRWTETPGNWATIWSDWPPAQLLVFTRVPCWIETQSWMPAKKAVALTLLNSCQPRRQSLIWHCHHYRLQLPQLWDCSLSPERPPRTEAQITAQIMQYPAKPEKFSRGPEMSACQSPLQITSLFHKWTRDTATHFAG